MSPRIPLALAVAALTTVSCASIPKDSGFGDVRQSVLATTGQPVAWDPRATVQPPTDDAVTALLLEELTADRAVQLAFANNRDVQATLEELGIARAELMAASTIRNPLFHAEVRFPADPQRPFELGLTQTLVDVFRLKNSRKLGFAQFAAARLRVSGAITNFAGQVRTGYFDLLAARGILGQRDVILKAQQVSAELAQRQHAAGNISDLDLEHEQSGYERVKLDHARAQLDELQAQERLTALLGLVDRATLKLPQSFPPLPETEPTVEDLLKQMLRSRLDIQVAQREIEAAGRAAALSGTTVWDEVALGVHYEKEPDGKRTGGPEIEVPIPIFDRGRADKTRARALLRQAQQRLAALTVNARSEARAAHERLTEARARVTYLREVVVPRKERIVGLTQLEYNAMLRGVFSLIQVRQQMAEAQREAILATRDYWTARTDLDSAVLGVGGYSVHPEGSATDRPAFNSSAAKPQSKEH